MAWYLDPIECKNLIAKALGEHGMANRLTTVLQGVGPTYVVIHDWHEPSGVVLEELYEIAAKNHFRVQGVGTNDE